MSDLSKALAAVGERAPERPLASRTSNAVAWYKHARRCEALALRLARRLAEANAVIAAEGIESDDEEDGTGKEQPR